MRPRFALPFTIVPNGDAVWLVAGEDVRFTLRGAGLASWLPAVLRACDGERVLADVIALAPAAQRDDARELLAGLVGERVLVDAGAAAAHHASPAAWTVDGSGRLAVALAPGATAGAALAIYAQDTLELAELRAHNARHLAAGTRWLWATIGPQARALVGPLFLPDAGPCAECVVEHFRLRSPVPELYDLIAAHPGPFVAADIGDDALALVAALVRWKLSLVEQALAPSALYTLHVVELATLEVSSHRVLINPECPACRRRGT